MLFVYQQLPILPGRLRPSTFSVCELNFRVRYGYIGEKKAKQLLEDNATWDTVVKAFKKHGLSELDALQQARVAYILRAKDIGDIDKLEKEGIRLWTPA